MARLVKMLSYVEKSKEKNRFNELVAQSARLVRQVRLKNLSHAEVVARIRIECDARVFVRLITGHEGPLN